MSLESQKYNHEDISSLASAYIKSVYVAKGDIQNQTTIKIKNQIVVLLSSIYKNILDSYFRSGLDTVQVTSFVQIVSHLIGEGIIHAKQDMYGFLLEKNLPLTHTDHQIEIVKSHILSQIDKNISQGRIEMDHVVELFRQRCLEILLEGQKSSTNMLHLSHKRSLQRISKLTDLNTGLEGQISTLTEENSQLKTQITRLKTDAEKKQKVINDGYKSWKKLNTRVGELEKERESILEILGKIETELGTKKRRLKGSTLLEKINGTLNFIREKQAEETTWQQTFVNQQNFVNVENNLKKQIQTLQEHLQSAKILLQEVNDELIDEQAKVLTLTATEESAIKEILKTQITNYFYFLFHTEDFINMKKQEEGEFAIKMTFYRAKVLHLDLRENIDNILTRLKIHYENAYPGRFEKIQQVHNNLKDFINGLEYQGRYFQKEVETYTDIYEMN